MTKKSEHKKGRKFYPHHALQSSIMVFIVFALILGLSYFFRVPANPDVPPMPDDGMYVPGPEWYSLFFFQPFWYLKGDLKRFLPIATFYLPLIMFLALILVPFLYKKKEGAAPKRSFAKRLLIYLPAYLVIILISVGIVKGSYQAKLYGCNSCHNPSMGVNMGMPPVNVGEFYRVNRQRQIEVGKFKAGKTVGENMTVVHGAAESYKDANWQMRHMYEPTFTW